MISSEYNKNGMASKVVFDSNELTVEFHQAGEEDSQDYDVMIHRNGVILDSEGHCDETGGGMVGELPNWELLTKEMHDYVFNNLDEHITTKGYKERTANDE